jgi:hypothetical protein
MASTQAYNGAEHAMLAGTERDPHTLFFPRVHMFPAKPSQTPKKKNNQTLNVCSANTVHTAPSDRFVWRFDPYTLDNVWLINVKMLLNRNQTKLELEQNEELILRVIYGHGPY